MPISHPDKQSAPRELGEYTGATSILPNFLCSVYFIWTSA